MNIRNNNGITLVIVVITVIILAIITVVTINVSTNIAELAKFEDVKSNLLQIQGHVKVMADKKVIGEITEDELYGIKQTSGDYNGWYLLSQGDLDVMNLEDLFVEDEYYVNYQNNDVAYGIGIEYKGTTYYKLSEMR